MPPEESSSVLAVARSESELASLRKVVAGYLAGFGESTRKAYGLPSEGGGSPGSPSRADWMIPAVTMNKMNPTRSRPRIGRERIVMRRDFEKLATLGGTSRGDIVEGL